MVAVDRNRSAHTKMGPFGPPFRVTGSTLMRVSFYLYKDVNAQILVDCRMYESAKSIQEVGIMPQENPLTLRLFLKMDKTGSKQMHSSHELSSF